MLKDAYDIVVSTHSRPKAAGLLGAKKFKGEIVSTHSRPKAAGNLTFDHKLFHAFQLTAARRRLDKPSKPTICLVLVSTHSRPKAAGDQLCNNATSTLFQLTAARRRLESQKDHETDIF